MYFVPFRSAPAAKVLEPITHNPENVNAPTGKTILMNFILQEQNKTTIKKLPKTWVLHQKACYHEAQRLKIKCWGLVITNSYLEYFEIKLC